MNNALVFLEFYKKHYLIYKDLIKMYKNEKKPIFQGKNILTEREIFFFNRKSQYPEMN